MTRIRSKSARNSLSRPPSSRRMVHGGLAWRLNRQARKANACTGCAVKYIGPVGRTLAGIVQQVVLLASLVAPRLCAQQDSRRPSPFPGKNREARAAAAAQDEQVAAISFQASGSFAGAAGGGRLPNGRLRIPDDGEGLLLLRERQRSSHSQWRPPPRRRTSRGACQLSIGFASQSDQSGQWKGSRRTNRRSVPGLQPNHQCQ
jgi:hypothetical protein